MQYYNSGVRGDEFLEIFDGLVVTLMGRWVLLYQILAPNSIDCPARGTSLAHILARYGEDALPLREMMTQLHLFGSFDEKHSDGQTPLLFATRNGHLAIARLLVENGADPNSKDRFGYTPLDWATKNSHSKIVQLFMGW
ncbi:ankyrin repeat-containing domain protein [Fusarium venenatum]|uniref:ankyrin repeat-containing domain protein n=1 Tax=Fusarium venenatum TaxID=56646 RepID=UPI001D2D7A97|nr:ankyrin repeat-containing domain protein [Fusarium venenatum]